MQSIIIHKSGTRFDATPLHQAILQNDIDMALKVIRESPDALYIPEIILSAHCSISYDEIIKESIEENPSNYVRTADGNIYNTEALERWVKQSGTHPMTREEISWEEIESTPLSFTPADYLGSQGSVDMFEAIISNLDPSLVPRLVSNVFNIATLHRNHKLVEASVTLETIELISVERSVNYLLQAMEARINMKTVPIGSIDDIQFINLVECFAKALPQDNLNAIILLALIIFKKNDSIAHTQFNRGLLFLIAACPSFNKRMVYGGDYNIQSFFKTLINCYAEEPITEEFSLETQIQGYSHVIQTYTKAGITCFVYFQNYILALLAREAKAPLLTTESLNSIVVTIIDAEPKIMNYSGFWTKSYHILCAALKAKIPTVTIQKMSAQKGYIPSTKVIIPEEGTFIPAEYSRLLNRQSPIEFLESHGMMR